MHWEDEYKTKKLVWGKEPSELARVAVEFLKKTPSKGMDLNILDIGCGYGRDALHYADQLPCTVLGIDSAAKGIEIARSTASEKGTSGISFECCDFKDLGKGAYDVVCASNLYQLLKGDERNALRKAVKRLLKAGGVFFLSTLSVNDPEHFGDGDPIPGEENSYSFKHRMYLHFCTREELSRDFEFLRIVKLYEHEYREPRVEGADHHHISWILVGQQSEGG